MEQRIRALGVMAIIVGILGAIAASGYFIFFGTSSQELSYIPVPDGFVGIWMALVLLLTLPYIVAGVGLWKLRPWSRWLSTIVLTCGMLSFPLGTALGIYGLWMLMSAEADEVFSPRFNGKRF